ncbi:hypothetical protein BC939DRAFT_262861 [Gamsiella multidivaricata]|uniref:uncharacterized protein n=1 Tax=Gamsiella multidivaricata TaxID=101098 RepID=UPI0022206B82|nr:uncharacterized protein BC939DRAFT_262861 [Gamsiella multidivaricata]KAI7819537.1 hypothetical protein BC939DRAFT_262861 [Gamsiella multidivaricata]
MPAPATLSASKCTASSSRMLVYIGCRGPQGVLSITGKRTPCSSSAWQRQQQQQRRLGHSWISGHPRSILYKPSTANNKASSAGYTGGMSGCNSGISGSPSNGASNSSSGNFSTFLDFAGNGRYQAYNLARFSTFSAVSSSSSSSSSSPTSSAPSNQDSGVAGSSTSSHTDRAHSNSAPADAQSPSSSSPSSSTLSTPPSPVPSSGAGLSTSTTALSSKNSHNDKEDKENKEDKEDDWAVNESYSGHGGHSFTSSTTEPSDASSSSSVIVPSSSRISGRFSHNNDSDASYEQSRTALAPSLLSPKSPEAIEASWRRTSETLPSVTSPPLNSILSPGSANKAGGLDLSSSTLVQQMLFKERAPHADNPESENNDEKQSDEGILRMR